MTAQGVLTEARTVKTGPKTSSTIVTDCGLVVKMTVGWT